MKKIINRRSLTAGLLVGTLDISAACIQYYSKTGKNPVNVLRYIAGAVFGKQAAGAGWLMPAAGLFFHYIIAVSFTFLFFALVRFFPSLLKQKIVTAIVYGCFMWAFMQYVIIPQTKLTPPVFSLERALIAIGILILCISLPLTYLAKKRS